MGTLPENRTSQFEHAAALAAETFVVVVIVGALLAPDALDFLRLSTVRTMPSKLPSNWHTFASADDYLTTARSADEAYAKLVTSKVWRVGIVRNETYRRLPVRILRGNNTSSYYIDTYESYAFWSEDTEMAIEVPSDAYGYKWTRFKLPTFLSVDVRPTQQQAVISRVREDAYGRRTLVR